ncbi:hypothetical protein [Arthrobacter sp. NPDC057013]|uniref:hypothetical protein n=1 Tax=Arthrobacter sp. NPDC057013 TaxID=3345999 RepID=UPI003641C08B
MNTGNYALGAIIGGAFAPMIATALVQATGTTASVSVYLLIVALVSTAALLVIRERRGIDLGINNQAEQEVGATVFDRRQADSADAAVRPKSRVLHPKTSHRPPVRTTLGYARLAARLSALSYSKWSTSWKPTMPSSHPSPQAPARRPGPFSIPPPAASSARPRSTPSRTSRPR